MTSGETVNAPIDREATERPAPVLWSVRLPEADAGHLLATPDGGCVVATPDFLASVGSSGRIDWLVETRPPWPPGGPARLPDGRLIREESGQLTVREPLTGGVLATVAAPGASGIAVTPDADLIYGTWTAAQGAFLNRISPDGELRWSRALDRQIFHAPLVLGHRLLLVDGTAVHGYDLDGGPQWAAHRQVRGPLVPLGPTLVLAGLDLIDPDTGAARRLDTEVPVHPPVAAIGSDGGLVAAGPVGEHEWNVVRLGPDGRVRWTHPIPAEPRTLLVDDTEQVFVVSSPSLERWRKYHHWYDLSGDSFIRCVGPSGDPRWAWHPAVPLTYPATLRGPGRILIGAPGRLWALG
jgi:hypothetical protein